MTLKNTPKNTPKKEGDALGETPGIKDLNATLALISQIQQEVHKPLKLVPSGRNTIPRKMSEMSISELLEDGAYTPAENRARREAIWKFVQLMNVHELAHRPYVDKWYIDLINGDMDAKQYDDIRNGTDHLVGIKQTENMHAEAAKLEVVKNLYKRLSRFASNTAEENLLDSMEYNNETLYMALFANFEQKFRFSEILFDADDAEKYMRIRDFIDAGEGLIDPKNTPIKNPIIIEKMRSLFTVLENESKSHTLRAKIESFPDKSLIWIFYKWGMFPRQYGQVFEDFFQAYYPDESHMPTEISPASYNLLLRNVINQSRAIRSV